MAVPALDRVTLQVPTMEHGTTAAANAPFLDAGADVAATLKPLGFQDLGNNQFEHADGSWIQYNPSRQTWERGVQQTHFRGMAQKITDWPTGNYQQDVHGWHVASHLLKFNPGNLSESKRQLEARGFVEVLPSYFTHSDGSFAAITSGKLYAGINGQVMPDLPAPGTRRKPSGQRPTPKHEVFTSLPFPRDWPRWRENFAVGKLPRADGRFASYQPEQLSRILTHLGFTSSGNNQWDHPDGSKVQTSGGLVRGSSFQQWGFGQFPYNVNTHWNQWQADTNAWNAWIQGTGQPPFPAYGT